MNIEKGKIIAIDKHFPKILDNWFNFTLAVFSLICNILDIFIISGD